MLMIRLVTLLESSKKLLKSAVVRKKSQTNDKLSQFHRYLLINRLISRRNPNSIIYKNWILLQNVSHNAFVNVLLRSGDS